MIKVICDICGKKMKRRKRDMRNSKKVKVIAVVTALCLVVWGTVKMLDGIEEAERQQAEREKELQQEETEPEPLVINTPEPINKGTLTVIDKKNEEVFQYVGDIHINFSESERKMYVMVYLEEAGWMK